ANLGQAAGELGAPRPSVPARELVDDHPPRVVPRTGVLAAGVAEPRDEQVERRGILAPTEEAHGDLAFGGAGLAGGVCLRLRRFFGRALGRFLALGDHALRNLLAFLGDLLGLLDPR